MDTTALKRIKGVIARIFARKRRGEIVAAPDEPGRFYVMFLDDGVSPGKLVTGTDFRKDLPREIKQAREDADTVNALKRAHTWFEEQEKRRQD